MIIRSCGFHCRLAQFFCTNFHTISPRRTPPLMASNETELCKNGEKMLFLSNKLSYLGGIESDIAPGLWILATYINLHDK